MVLNSKEHFFSPMESLEVPDRTRIPGDLILVSGFQYIFFFNKVTGETNFLYL